MNKSFLSLLIVVITTISLSAFFATLSVGAEESEPLPVILDTDMDTDCDDLGTMAVLHTLANQGKIRIVGTMVSSNYRWSAPCVAAVNEYYGRGNLPLGVPKGPGASVDRGSQYARQIAERFPSRFKTNDDAPNAVTVYRQLLAAEKDESVVIVTIGYLTNLSDLLKSPPDAVSPLDGRQLVARKVKRYVCMGGRYPQQLSYGNWGNFMPDPKAVHYVVNNWPLRITFSGDGEKILTGRTLDQTPENNPVRYGYQLYLGKKKVRPSWDQVTLLYAVMPVAPFWKVTVKGSNHIFENGTNQWREVPDLDHHLVQVHDDQIKALTKYIDTLMATSPKDAKVQ